MRFYWFIEGVKASPFSSVESLSTLPLLLLLLPLSFFLISSLLLSFIEEHETIIIIVLEQIKTVSK